MVPGSLVSDFPRALSGDDKVSYAISTPVPSGKSPTSRSLRHRALPRIPGSTRIARRRGLRGPGPGALGGVREEVSRTGLSGAGLEPQGETFERRGTDSFSPAQPLPEGKEVWRFNIPSILV